MSDDCVFCSIATGKIPTKLVYEDDDCVAFEDLNPQAPAHTLVIPRRHIATLDDTSEDDTGLLGCLMRAAVRVAAQKGLGEEGYRVVVNCGAGAGQSVFHIHLHVLGGRPMGWPPG